MSISDHDVPNRRRFLEVSTAAALGACLPRGLAAQAGGSPGALAVNPKLLPTADEIWGWLEMMSKDGPRFTGNPAHKKYVDFLADGFQSAGLNVGRDTYPFTRWSAKSWSLKAMPKGGRAMNVPVSHFYPQSGQTGPAGVTGLLTYVGKITTDGGPLPGLTGDLKGKIALLDYDVIIRHYEDWYTPWGFHTPDTTIGPVMTAIIAVATPLMTEYKKAGAAGVIIAWTNLSDDHSAHQHLPFGRALQDMPTLYVGRTAGADLKRLANQGATVTLTLDADLTPNSTTDSVYATLPGASADEVVMVTTHTDGANCVQENGGLGLLSLARYFSKIPQGSRRRTLVFAATTGHYAGYSVPSIGGFIEKHPDVIKKTVASITMEHLGCREWIDDASMKYVATGKDDLSFAVAARESIGKLMLESLQGTEDRRVVVAQPTAKGRYLGEGGTLNRQGIPAVGYFAGPGYLNMVAPDGCLSKLSKTHFHGQIAAFAKFLHRVDATPAASLKGPEPARSQG